MTEWFFGDFSRAAVTAVPVDWCRQGAIEMTAIRSLVGMEHPTIGLLQLRFGWFADQDDTLQIKEIRNKK